jgi:hypothetical protein
MRIERRKARSRAFVYGILVLAIMLFMTLMILVVMRKTKPQPQFLFIQHGTVTHSVSGTALILRDDRVQDAPASGQLQPLAAEGTRVARGQKVALVIPDGLEGQLAELEKCERDIVDLQNQLMNQGKGAGARAIYNESNSSLSSIINLIRADLAEGQLANLPTYSASLDVIIDQRTTRLSAVDFRDARLDQLMAQRRGLEDSLGLSSGTMISTQPGTLSFHLDGLEDLLQISAAEQLTIDQYQDYLRQVAEGQLADRSVSQGQPVLRVTSSLEQRLAVYLDGMAAADLDPARSYTLTVPADGTTVKNCRIQKLEPGSKGVLVIFSTDHKVEWFADRRTFAAELAVAETSGMKIPRVSLIGFDEQRRTADIMLVNGGYTWQVPVVVLDYDREYAVIEAQSESAAIASAEVAGGAGQEAVPGSSLPKPTVSAVIVANPDSIGAGEFIGE